MLARNQARTLIDAEASRYIGMSESWLRQSRTADNPDAPPFIKIGRAVRYLKDDLDAWLEARRHPKRALVDREQIEQGYGSKGSDDV